MDDADLSVAGRRRGMHNRLGFSVQLATVRVVGRFLTDPLVVPRLVVESLAGQLGSWAVRMLPLSSFTRSGGRPVTSTLRRFLPFMGRWTSLIQSSTTN